MIILQNAEVALRRKTLKLRIFQNELLFPTFQVNNHHLKIYSIGLNYLVNELQQASLITLLRKHEYITSSTPILHRLIVTEYPAVLIILLICI